MFKDKEEVELFNYINKYDTKTPIERVLKLSEECREVSEAMLSAYDVFGCDYKPMKRSDVIKECVDVIIEAKSIIASAAGDVNHQMTLNVVNDIYDTKMAKWQEKCSMPPVEADCISEHKEKDPNVFSYKKFVEDRMVIPSTIKHRACLEKMDGFAVGEKHGKAHWYTIIGTNEDVHEDWIVSREEWTPYGHTIECSPKKKEPNVFCHKKYAEDPFVTYPDDKKAIDGMIIELEDGDTDILNVFAGGEDGVGKVFGTDLYVHKDWIVPKSEFELRMPADTLVVDVQKMIADMGTIDDVCFKLDGVEVFERDFGKWYKVKYEEKIYDVHTDWLTAYGEYIKRKWGE